jgi:hypothetical protein
MREGLPEVELFCAKNGSDAIDILIHESPILIVIVDGQLQDEEQLLLAEDLLEVAGQKPIIFLSSHEQVKDVLTSEFFNSLSTNEMLEKPYRTTKLIEKIKKALEWSDKNTESESHKKVEQDDYVPVKLKSFYLYEKVGYDVYFKVYTDNYMLVITKNKRYPESAIVNLAKKNVKELYLKRTEKIKFLTESIDKAIIILSDPEAKVDKLMTSQICAVFLIHEMINEIGVNESLVHLAELIISSKAKVAAQYRDFKTLARDIPITYGDLGEQAVYMLYLSHFITKALDWESEMTQKKLGLACILHDCKLKYDDLSLVRNENDESLKEFNLHSLKIFKEHPKLASKVSTEFTNFPDCTFIIEEHHTLPVKRYTHNMNTISCLFVLLRRFTTELANHGFSGLCTQKAIEELEVYAFGNFKKSYDALIKILK